uniref:Gastrin/cholecystokinin peptide hormone domain-containing protein n=2 Tax=Latimeria chalumnae TaxID=7897 RepID=H3AJ73_LATCH
MNNKVCVSLLVAVLATACLARSVANSRRLDRASVHSDASGRAVSHSGMVRRDAMGSLTPEQRHFVSKFLPQMYAELSNGGGFWKGDSMHPVHDRDYDGWMDFGRRSAEDLEEMD